MTNQELIKKLRFKLLSHIASTEEIDTEDDYSKGIELAIEALEKQNPKVPVTILRNKDLIGYKCPNCWQDNIPLNKPCCWWCGQALNWKLAYKGV